jgi:putative ABC transport system ATP-binding protein
MLSPYTSQVIRCQTRLCWPRSRPLLTNLGLGRLHPPFPICHSFQLPSRTWATQSPPNNVAKPLPSSVRPKKSSILSKVLPDTFIHPPPTASSFRKIVSLAKPERKPLLIAIGLLLVSSSVSMSIPFTIGKLIDYFSSATPVRMIFNIHASRYRYIYTFVSQQIPYGLSLSQASAILLFMFTTGALANAGRAFLMRMSGL